MTTCVLVSRLMLLVYGLMFWSLLLGHCGGGGFGNTTDDSVALGHGLEEEANLHWTSSLELQLSIDTLVTLFWNAAFLSLNRR